MNLFVGPESVRFSGGLATPVADGAEVSILPAVSGGARRDPASPSPRERRAPAGGARGRG